MLDLNFVCVSSYYEAEDWTNKMDNDPPIVPRRSHVVRHGKVEMELKCVDIRRILNGWWRAAVRIKIGFFV